MSMDKVSVIVPIYNVARYLDRCVNSILCQTYSELEVLLIDDGSTDESGSLCDAWERKDPRIRVIHKSNGGLSDARNAGLDVASGEYIVFVDSDDYIAADMIKTLYEAIIEDHANLSLCNFLYVDEDGEELPARNRDLPIRDECITGSEAIQKMLAINQKGWYYITAWNKLYSANLFSEIRFPAGKLHEDEFTAYKVFAQCERVACVSAVGYYYVQRSGSIMHGKSRKSRLHAAEAYLEQALFCSHKKDLHRSAGRAYLKAAMALADASGIQESIPTLKEEYKNALQLFRQNRHMKTFCSRKEKMQVSLVSFSPPIYRVFLRNSLRQGWKNKHQ